LDGVTQKISSEKRWLGGQSKIYLQRVPVQGSIWGNETKKETVSENQREPNMGGQEKDLNLVFR